jgi:argininosuccinate lyase
VSDADDSVAKGKALWHGRFAAAPAEELMSFTASISFDKRLWADDITGSRAHVAMLGATGILDGTTVSAIDVALSQVYEEMSSGRFEFVESDEDIHTAIERRVTQIAGDAGARVHTGRSRNDQVATALRLWCKREIRIVIDALLELVDVLHARATEADAANPPVYLPGYTHLQRAQPVLLSHHLRAHGWALMRDADRLFDALTRLDVSPLGAGALAGSSLPIDPQRSADLLGFGKPFDNSLDAVSDRDYVAELLAHIALLGVHLSRIGEEWVLWTSEEFGFATLDDAYATGSSMLPQKKNADIAELARGKAGRLIGNLTGLLTTLKGLPLAYNRDLQEDKEPLFDSVDHIRRALVALAGMISSATFKSDAMVKAGDAEELAATDLAEWLVERGMPFRRAHAIVGEAVRTAINTHRPLVEVVSQHPELGSAAAQLISAGSAISRRRSRGGAGPEVSSDQATRFTAELKRLRQRF